MPTWSPHPGPPAASQAPHHHPWGQLPFEGKAPHLHATGVGNTHLAIALGREAITAGNPVLFVTAFALYSSRIRLVGGSPEGDFLCLILRAFTANFPLRFRRKKPIGLMDYGRSSPPESRDQCPQSVLHVARHPACARSGVNGPVGPGARQTCCVCVPKSGSREHLSPKLRSLKPGPPFTSALSPQVGRKSGESYPGLSREAQIGLFLPIGMFKGIC
jgi:IstB-like ATP binding protein